MKRIWLCILFMLAIAMFVSCDPAESPEVTTEAMETEPPVVIRDIVFTGGENAYTIIRPTNASDTVINAAVKLYRALAECDSNIRISEDWIKPGDPIPEYEIIVGNAERDEIAEMISEVPYCGYAVKVIGNKLVILATNDEYVDDAVDYVMSLISDNKLILKEDHRYSQDLKEGGYPLFDALIENRKLTEYSIYSKNQELAKSLQKVLGEQTGLLLPIVSKDHEGPMFVIGSSAKESFAPIEYYEYRIESKGENVYFLAYGAHEYGHSFKMFVDALLKADNHVLKLTESIDSYKLPAREEYIKDISKLYMLWDYLWEAPEWMLDYDDKKASMFGGKGSEKLYASAHRAELGFYPENSIEAVISTYYMGAAIAELDFGATKDGVLVLLHDNTLTRTTNVADFMGKPGYPNSANVSDWTYAQLMDLNLKEGGGGQNAEITPFKIATLEEALIVCKDRLFIVPDKYANWQYVKSTDIMQGSLTYYLSDLMKKTGNCESILISYGISDSSNYLNSTDAVKLQKLLKQETGVTPFILLRCQPDAVRSNYEYFNKNAEPASFALQLNGDYRATTGYAAPFRTHGDKVTFLAWTIGDTNDIRKNWEDMYKKGLRVIMTNDLFNLAQYCEEIGERVMAENNG